MLIAIIFICNIGIVEECDEKHAIWMGQASGFYATEEKCQQGAVAWLHTVDVSEFLTPGESYQITISCHEDSI